jgi:pimeloyl-ACP methyl ester carboxylesterase
MPRPVTAILLLLAGFLAVSCDAQVTNSGNRTGKASPQLPWVRHHGPARSKGVIIFVHGVLGDARSTWSNRTIYWPELLTGDPTFDGEDVFVYEYPTPKFSESFSISEIADNLRLVLSTEKVLDYRQISIISHSMGGLVTRDFIVKYQSIVVPKIRFLIFFATPTTGTPYATLARLISKNHQFGQMFPMQSDNYLGTLQGNWLAGGFRIRSYCAYETLPLFGQIIVERQSATNLCTEHLEPIDADHINIVKPLNTGSTAYRVLKSAFEETRPASASPQDSLRARSNNQPPPQTTPVSSEGDQGLPGKAKQGEKGTRKFSSEAQAPATPSVVNNAPGGVANSGTINGGVVINGPPRPKLSFTEQSTPVSPEQPNGNWLIEVHISTDRTIPGARVGVLFSGSVDPLQAQGAVSNSPINEVEFSSLARDGIEISSGLYVAVNIPASLSPNQELKIRVKTKTNVHVLAVGIPGQ